LSYTSSERWLILLPTPMMLPPMTVRGSEFKSAAFSEVSVSEGSVELADPGSVVSAETPPSWPCGVCTPPGVMPALLPII
jgi:hypothetical protein